MRSLQVHYDGAFLSRDHLLEALDACEEQIPDLDNLVLPSRIVHLAAVLGRSGYATGDCEIYAIGAAGCSLVS